SMVQHEQPQVRAQTSTITNSGKQSPHSEPACKTDPMAYPRAFGNQAVQRLLRSRMIQAKLKVSTPGDKYEQEADRVADAVMRLPAAGGMNAGQSETNARDLGIQRMCGECEEELHRQP